jgi:hypothetical protein
MKSIRFAALVAVGLALIPTTSALGGITLSDPGIYASIQDHFEARIRLDAGDRETWKTAFLEGPTLIIDSGARPGVFANGKAYPFTLRYHAGTGLASLRVADLAQDYTFPLPPGRDLAGFRFLVTSPTDGSATTVTGLTAVIDGGAPLAIPAISTAGNDVGLVEGPTVNLDAPGTELVLAGSITFDWTAGSNLSDERYRLSVHFFTGIILTGACCSRNASCHVLSMERCAELGGTYQGDQIPCGPTSCQSVPMEPSSWGRIKDLYRHEG